MRCKLIIGDLMNSTFKHHMHSLQNVDLNGSVINYKLGQQRHNVEKSISSHLNFFREINTHD